MTYLAQLMVDCCHSLSPRRRLRNYIFVAIRAEYTVHFLRVVVEARALQLTRVVVDGFRIGRFRHRRRINVTVRRIPPIPSDTTAVM